MTIEGTLKVGMIDDYPSSTASRSHCRIAVCFPDTPQRLSNPVPVSESFDFEYETTFPIDLSVPNIYDTLVSEPLKIILHGVSSDSRHQTLAFEFQVYLDPLLIHRKTSFEADLIGKHCEGGEFDASTTAPSLHISFELSEPLISKEDSEGSTVMKLRAEEIKGLTKAILSSTLHQDDQVHPFDYNIAFKFPCGRIITLPPGRFCFTDPPSIKWDTVPRLFLPSASVKSILEPGAMVYFEIWREVNEDFSSFGINDIVSPLISGRGSFSCTEFTKPGQSHFAGDISINRMEGGGSIRQADVVIPADDIELKKKGSVAAKGKLSSRSSRRRTKRVATAKDKKQLKVLAQVFSELTPSDGYENGTFITVDLQFSHAIVLKPLVPHPTIKPSDLVQKNPLPYSHKLEQATRDFREAVQRLAGEIITAQNERSEFQLAVPDFPDDLVPLLSKEPSYHVALEKLRLAITNTFSEFSLAHAAQSETHMKQLQSILPFFLHDELVKQLPDYFIKSKKPVELSLFLKREAEEAETMGRHEAASELLEELIALELDNAESWWLYSKLMLKHGDLSRAEECVRRGLACDPNHLSLSILFASLLTRQEKYFEALDFIKLANFRVREVEIVISILNGLANIPNPDPVLHDNEEPLSVASYFMDLMDVVFAEQLIAQEQMKSGETVDVLLSFGRLHYLLRDFVKSVSFLQRAVKMEKNPDGLLLLGHVEFERGRYEESASWFEQGLSMQFEQRAAMRLGFIYIKQGDYLKAEGYLFQCSPQSATVLLGLGITSMKLEKYKQADEFLNYASVVNFRHPDVWAYLALFSKKVDRLDEAEHAASKALEWNLRDLELKQELANEGLIVI